MIIVALLATAQTVSACGSMVVDQPMPSVPLSEFGINSSLVATPKKTVTYTYDFSRCYVEEKRVGNIVPVQKFPSVPLSEFGVNSWMFAK